MNVRRLETHVIADPNLVTINAADAHTGVGTDISTACITHVVATRVESVNGSLSPWPGGDGNAERWEDLLILCQFACLKGKGEVKGKLMKKITEKKEGAEKGNGSSLPGCASQERQQSHSEP